MNTTDTHTPRSRSARVLRSLGRALNPKHAHVHSADVNRRGAMHVQQAQFSTITR